jgi:polysaccharide pyruvyl transferase WcaK-like protein
MVLSKAEKSKQEISNRDSSSLKKIGLMGCWGFGNMGNAAHQVAMIQNIRKYQPNAQIYGFAVYPEITKNINGIPCFTFYRHPHNGWWEGDGKNFLTNSLNKFSTYTRKISNPVIKKLFIPLRVPVETILEIFALVRAFRIIKGFDMLIVTGGGHFDDVYGGARVLPYGLFVWSLITRLRKVNFLVLSNGAGPITEPLSKFFFKQALSSASYRSYRDEDSKQYVARVLDFQVKDDPVYPDLAHSLDLTRYQTHAQPRKDRRTMVGIALIPHKYAGTLPGLPGSHTPTYLNYLIKLAAFVSWLLENQYIIFLFVADESDRDSVQDFKQILENNHQVDYSAGQIIEQPPTNYNESTFDNFMNQLTATDLVVASRFHGVLLPQLLNKPTLALSFAQKTTVLMETTGQAEYCLPIDQFEVETLKERFIALEANQATIARQLADRTDRYRAALDEQYAHLFGDR